MATMAEPTTTVTARIPQNVKGELDALVKATGRNRSLLVAEALRRFIDVQRWQISQIEEGIRAADAGDFATQAEMDELWSEFGLAPETLQERAAG